MTQDTSQIRGDFPILAQADGQQSLTYFDSASTTQKPQVVINAMQDFYTSGYANAHRGMYPLAEQASGRYEAARNSVADFLGAASAEEIVWTSGTTASIHLVAQSYVRPRLKAGDAVVISIAEHHSNFVPWQQLCKAAGAELRVIPLTSTGEIDSDTAKTLLDEKVRILSITHISNVTGLVSPVTELIQLAHAKQIPVLLDAAQSVAHMAFNVRELDVDFLALSGHKLYGPTGIGVLYAKRALLEQMEPVTFGGDMIRSVTIADSTWNDIPYRFEAGTPNIVGVIGLAAAIAYVQQVGLTKIERLEREILKLLADRLTQVDGVSILIPQIKNDRHGAISFTYGTYHPHDVAALLGEQNVAVRGGDHCAQPLHQSLGLKGSIRASLGMYSSSEDVDRLIAGLEYVRKTLG